MGETSVAGAIMRQPRSDYGDGTQESVRSSSPGGTWAPRAVPLGSFGTWFGSSDRLRMQNLCCTTSSICNKITDKEVIMGILGVFCPI